MVRWIGLSALVASLLAGCGSGGGESQPEASAIPCQRPSKLVVSSIEEGLTIDGGGSLTNAWAVRVPVDQQNTSGWPELLVAADLDGPGMEGGDEIAVWATSNGYGPIWAIDSIAREFSDWGTAAQPGSEARAAMDALSSGDAYEAVRDCATR